MTWKDFIAKLEIYHKDVKTATFYYFKQLKKFLLDCQVNIVEIDEYMHHLNISISQKFLRFTLFWPYAFFYNLIII